MFTYNTFTYIFLTFVCGVSISFYIFGKLRLDGGTTEKGSSSS